MGALGCCSIVPYVFNLQELKGLSEKDPSVLSMIPENTSHVITGNSVSDEMRCCCCGCMTVRGSLQSTYKYTVQDFIDKCGASPGVRVGLSAQDNIKIQVLKNPNYGTN
jgi:hypothetical protein